MNNIRNFSIIAHIDHGKSTLADRMLEITGTVEKRKMREQVLDTMELERERGITIKMQPVRMNYKSKIINQKSCPDSKFLIHDSSDLKQKFVLNLIDTPGHIDFSYEVSRALKAVEGSILLVDCTQGVQAQTLTVLGMAREQGLTIIPVLSKIDSPLARIQEVKQEVMELLNCENEDMLEVSGKTGEGVTKLFEKIIKKIPPPKSETSSPVFRSLVFDFQYSNHKGVIVFIRVMNGEVKKNDNLVFKISGKKFNALEVGTFAPEQVPAEKLEMGEIGYIVTGIKEPGIASVGDTISGPNDSLPPLPGYMSPKPVVWSSIYPKSRDDFVQLRQALSRLKLSDSSFTYEEESSGMLGRGFRSGFLGMLHLEIISERLRREFNLELVVTVPSITYEVWDKKGKKEMVYSPSKFPEEHLIQKIMEPWVRIKIISPPDFLSPIMVVLHNHEAKVGDSETFGGNRNQLTAEMPLRELMRGFFDKIKSVSSGFASMSYEIIDMREADVVKLELLVADEPVQAFTRVVSRRTAQEEAEKSAEKLFTFLPRQMFTTKIQAKAMGRILASRTLSAMKKDVTQHMYGGDITRKMKLREKQKKGKKKMKQRGEVNIPHDVFIKMMKTE